jgi:endoglucanase
MFRKSYIWLIALLLTSCNTSTPELQQDLTEPPAEQAAPLPEEKVVSATRLERLSYGLNVTWLVNSDGYYNREQVTKDLDRFERLGVRHVRLVGLASAYFDEKNPTDINPVALRRLEEVIRLTLARDIAVIVDPLHYVATPSGYVGFEVPNRSMTKRANAMVVFWGKLAEALRDTDPRRVFLEVVNEPATYRPATWYRLQEKILAAMRKGAPKHTLIAAANLRVKGDWDNIAGLTTLTPVSDSNVVYNFHYYNPMVFTHQGAEWLNTFKCLSKVPYPSSPERVRLALVSPDCKDAATAQNWINYYGQEQWNLNKLRGDLKRAADWAKTFKVPVICNEIGAYKTPTTDKLRYYRDLATALAELDIGWTAWANATDQQLAALGLSPTRSLLR